VNLLRRRRLLAATLAFPLAALAQPRCGALTPRDAEGPFYKPGAPRRVSLIEPGAKGERLILAGTVYSPQCHPVPGALLDFWHADEAGEYDNAGFRYRGVQLADAQGRYRLETILPARYPGRPRHIHVKVRSPGKRALTTQIYFADEVRGALATKLERRDGTLHAAFDFVVDA
jgi:protocatechuate 3,4-dioxygenase beta subunit